MNKVFKASFASVVSELQQSDIFMTVKARLFETPKANLNGVRLTPAFLDEVVKNEEKYVGLPLVADVKALANGRYDHLGHLYDAKTGQFHSTQIGSFYKFEKEEFDGGAYLVGYARIAKRNKHICHAISELFADNALKFSFEISCGEYVQHDDGTTEIDVADCNFLEGEAIVSFPACEDAVALELVAECDKIADDLQKGEENMTDINESQEVVIEAEENKAQNDEPEETQAEEEEAECKKEKQEKGEEELAAVYVTKEHHEEDRVELFDDETNKCIVETTTSSTIEHERMDDVSFVADADGDGEGGSDGNGGSEEGGEDSNTSDPNAGNNNEAGTENNNEAGAGDEGGADSGASDSDAGSEDVADSIVIDVEQQYERAEAEAMIEQLRASIEELKQEIAELRETKASKPVVEVASVNPFVSELDDGLSVKPKYSLLEKADTKNKYSLLEKA